MAHSRQEFIQILGIGMGASLINGLPDSGHHAALIKPPQLQRGDTIGLISPAFSMPKEKQYGQIIRKIQRQGFKVKVGAHAEDHFGYFAGTDKHRAADVNAMFANSDVDAIMPFRGGWGCDRILDDINFDLISRNPKPLIGFSDITTLLLAIHAKTGLVTYHGPLGESKWTPFTKKYFKKALMQRQPFTLKNKEPGHLNDKTTTIRKGRAEGRLLGGNLSVLSSMMGSDYLPDWKGSILFVEDVDEDIYSIDRMLTQLHLNGIFEQINGFVFGKCTSCDVHKGHQFTLEQVVQQHLKDYDIPAFIGADFGHIDNIFTIPIGLKAEIFAAKGELCVLEAPVS